MPVPGGRPYLAREMARLFTCSFALLLGAVSAYRRNAETALRGGRLELPLRLELEPKSSASSNSATLAAASEGVFYRRSYGWARRGQAVSLLNWGASEKGEISNAKHETNPKRQNDETDRRTVGKLQTSGLDRLARQGDARWVGLLPT